MVGRFWTSELHPANCELVVDNPSHENPANRQHDTDVWTNKISKWKRTDYDTMRR